MFCRTMKWLFMLAEMFVEMVDIPSSRLSPTTNDY